MLFICPFLPAYFNPRSPWGERPGSFALPLLLLAFQSTLPVGGATNDPLNTTWERRISIHAPRGGSDEVSVRTYKSSRISIHAPRGGSDCFSTFSGDRDKTFQSTLPVGGATTNPEIIINANNISIHAPRGGSDKGWENNECRN